MSARHGALLLLGVTAVSFSAPLIRFADADPLAIALYRNVFAAALVLPIAWSRGRAELRSLTGRDWALLALAGALLALHFVTWIPSVTLTTVAASTVLVSTQPVFAAAGGRVLFGEGIRARTLVGITVALVGAAIVSGGDFTVSGEAFLGDLLALAGAVFGAGYLLSGRALRRRLSLLTYAGIVYATCALFLVPAVLVSGTPFAGYPGRVWLVFALLAMGPQILGHTTFNFLLKDLEATVVAVAIMGEPVGASLLAVLFFGEIPPPAVLAGGALILFGIYAALTSQARRTAAAPVE